MLSFSELSKPRIDIELYETNVIKRGVVLRLHSMAIHT